MKELTLWMAVLLAGSLSLPAQNAGPSQDASGIKRTLATARDAHELTVEQSRLAYPVRLTGMVTYADWLTDAPKGYLFLQDRSGTVYVDFCQGFDPALRPGDLVSIEGTSGPGQFAPVVLGTKLIKLGHSALPEASFTSISRMLTGAEDGQWRDLKGVVLSAEILDPYRMMLDVQADAGVLAVTIMHYGSLNPDSLIGSSVILRGNCAPYFNQLRQLTGVRLFVPGFSQVTIVKPATAAFSLPLQPIGNLMRYTPGLIDVHRVRVRGTVTFSSHTRLTIQDQNDATQVQLKDHATFSLGDEVDAIGFPAPGEYTSILRYGFARRTGKRWFPAPVAVSAKQVLEGSFDLKLVRLHGRLVEAQSGGTGRLLVSMPDGTVIEAYQPVGQMRRNDLREGSDLQLSGICEVHLDHNRVPTSFSLTLRAPEDIVVLRAASWWSVGHVALLLCGTVLVTMVIVAWVLILRRKVNEQTEVIRRQLAEAAMLAGKAEAANQAKSEFLANMSHEIRTPLNGVLGMIDLTLQTQLTTDQFEYLDLARTSAKSLLTIIGDILDFSKIEAGKLELCPVEFNPRRLLEETTRMFSAQAQDKSLQLTCQVDPALPGLVVGDSARLRQVLVNLVGNALKFTAQGRVTIAAQVKSASHDRVLVQFSVADTGIGIPREKHQLIFAAFSQADLSTTRKYGGTGLGLAISSRIVALLGGTLALDSVPGQGSTFHFTSDLAIAPGSSSVQEMRAHPRKCCQSAPLRILVAEDNLVNQKLICRKLENAGHLVALAANGRQALQMLHENAFDLALMDVQMPELDGLEVTALLRKEEKVTGDHLPVIAVTARAIAEDEEICLQSGMDAYVSKPIDTELLFSIMDRLLASAVRSFSHHAPASLTPSIR